MRSEEEIREMINELENAVNVDNIEEYDRVAKNGDFKYLCNILDALSWVLEEISTDDFKSDAYINLDKIKNKAKGKLENKK